MFSIGQLELLSSRCSSPGTTGQVVKLELEGIVKAYEFKTKVTPDGKLDVPEALTDELQSQPVVRVIVLISEPTDIYEEQAWSRLTAEQFLAGYDDADAVYDGLN